MNAELEDELVRLARSGEPVAYRLLGGGRLRIDRQVPFLLVYRGQRWDALAAELVTAGPSYLIAGPDDPEEAVRRLVGRLAESLAQLYGGYLVLELWASDAPRGPVRLHHPEHLPVPRVLEGLQERLRRLELPAGGAEVQPEPVAQLAPPGRLPLMRPSTEDHLDCLLLGLEIPPVYREPETCRPYWSYFHALRHQLWEQLRRALFQFTRDQTRCSVGSYRVLGRRTVDEAALEADKVLAKVDGSFEFIMLLSAANHEQAWERFRASGYRQAPRLHYRLRPVDTDRLKQEIYNLDLTRVEDPALAFLLRDKREEIEKKLTLLEDRGRPEFLYTSLRLYKPVDAPLRAAAERVLAEVPRSPPVPEDEYVDAEVFRRRAAEEFAYYRSQYPAFDAEIRIRHHYPSLMVSQGHLNIGAKIRLQKQRIEALVQHEIGTHVVTHTNGLAQPLELLAHGLAGYDEMQEGLGVLAEYLVGGLTRDRLRLLAARVLTVDAVTRGVSFADAYASLTESHGLSAEAAWWTVLRVYQAGGLTSDVVYLRGLLQVLEYLRQGGELEPLYLGKMGQQHLDIIRELRERGILRPMPVRPRFLDDPAIQPRLDRVRAGVEVTALVEAA